MLLRIAGWVLVVIGSITDPTEKGQTIMLFGIVLVLLALTIGKAEKGTRR